MHQFTFTDVTMAAPASFNLTTFPRSNHFCPIQPIVNTSRSDSDVICCINQSSSHSNHYAAYKIFDLLVLRSLTMSRHDLLLHSFPGTIQNFYDNFFSRRNGTNIASPCILFTLESCAVHIVWKTRWSESFANFEQISGHFFLML